MGMFDSVITGGTGGVSEEELQNAIDALVGMSPETLNTIQELAAALGDDPDFLTTLQDDIAGKAPSNHSHAQSDVTGLETDLSDLSEAANRTQRMTFIIDGNGASIVAGTVAYFPLGAPGTITGWYMVQNDTGSIQIDPWIAAWGADLPTVSDSIAASDKPFISSAKTNSDLSPTGWTPDFEAGDIMAIKVDSASGAATKAAITFLYTPS